MENTRRSQDTLAILEMVFLILATATFFFALYILPYILFGWTYSVPHFVVWLQYWYAAHQGMDSFFAIFTPLFLISLLLFYIARRLNFKMEAGKRRIDVDEISRMERFLTRPHSIMKLFLILCGIVIVLLILGSGIDDLLAGLLS